MFHWLRRKKIVQTGWGAGAYLINGRVVIHSMSRTRNNIGWFNQPVLVVSDDASNELLGERLREALKASTWDSLEDDSEEKLHPILRAAGVKSWRALADQAKFAGIETDMRLVKVIPSRPPTKSEGGRGFMHQPELQVEINWDCSDADLGVALRRGFGISQSKTKH